MLRFALSGEGLDTEDRAAAARDDSPNDAGEPDAGIGVEMMMGGVRGVEVKGREG